MTDSTIPAEARELDARALRAASKKITGGSTFDGEDRLQIAKEVVRTYLRRARPAASPSTPEGYKLVPDSALAWLFGEAPDANGRWFSDAAELVAPLPRLLGGRPPQYWWRSHFRKLIAASAPHLRRTLMARKTTTKSQLCNAIARSLREFGYPDALGEMIEETMTAWLAGKRFPDLPHGVIGAMAERQFQELADAGHDLSLLESSQ